jgi:DNA-binding transcriptional LysR family regulator
MTDEALLHGLQTFHAVASARSYTRAAARLRLSQPAVSARIRVLERHYGAPLLETRHRRVYLTPEGEALFAYTERVFHLVRESEREVAAVRRLARGRLVLGASATIGAYLLPRYLGAFAAARPGVEISLAVGTTAEVLTRVLSDEVPLGLVEAPVSHPEVDARPFAADELILVAAPDHPWAAAGAVGVEALRGARILRREAGSGTQAIVDAALARHGLTLPTAMALGDTEALKQAVMAGLGVAWVSRVTVERELAGGAVRRVATPGLAITRPLFEIVRRDRRLPPAAAAFRELVRRGPGGGPDAGGLPPAGCPAPAAA